LTTDPYWFTRSPEEIQKLKDDLPPIRFNLAEAFLVGLEKARGVNQEKEFLDFFFNYTDLDESTIIELVKQTCYDLDL
jgi:hypothetical protein